MSEPVRLSKRMSELGISSRREADEWIEKGWVKVDGKVVSQLGSKVLPHQKITIEKQASQEQSRRVTILINKPMGYVSFSRSPGGPRNMNEPYGLFGSDSPARERRIASETATIASCWPTTRLCR